MELFINFNAKLTQEITFSDTQSRKLQFFSFDANICVKWPFSGLFFQSTRKLKLTITRNINDHKSFLTF
jgi:hypothetical protein